MEPLVHGTGLGIHCGSLTQCTVVLQSGSLWEVTKKAETGSSVVHDVRMRDNRHKLRFRQEMWKNVSPVRVVRQQNRLPWEVVPSPCFRGWKCGWIMAWAIWSDPGVELETSWDPHRSFSMILWTYEQVMCTILIKHFTHIFLSHWRSEHTYGRSKTLTRANLNVGNYSEYIKNNSDNTCFEFIFVNCRYRNYSKGQRVFEFLTLEKQKEIQWKCELFIKYL